MTRDTIFISHAVLPKDNEFVLWLASRLQLLGYKVWCDLRNLKGGEQDFWGSVIEPQIRNAAKVVVIVSKASILRQGVIDEYNFARGIASENDLKDFVIPIRIEDVPFTARISLNSYNVINCVDNWQSGLSALIQKLDEDGVEKPISSIINDEFKTSTLDNYSKIFPKRELYYTSWLCPLNIPENMYLFKYDNAQQAKTVLRYYSKQYPISRHGNYLFSFHDQINYERIASSIELEFASEDIKPLETIKIKISDIPNNIQTEFPTQRDCEYLLKRLFNWTLSFHLTKRGLRGYELANNKYCYYYPINYKQGNKVNVNYHNRKKRKNLVGNFLDWYWHMAISFNFRLEPYPAYELKSHILFSDDGENIWKSTSKLHSARRKKGRTWFNEQWRDQLMAFLFYLAKPDENEYFSLSVSDETDLRIPFLTKTYYSSVGYQEPNTKDRLTAIDDRSDEIELDEILNEDNNDGV